jgi:RimJ/RimL family protein N-acetyltransferase
MVEIAHAQPEEREEIAQFMAEVFPKAKWSIDGWRRLLGNRWAGPQDSFAITARDNGRLVGVLGLVTARRPTPQGDQVTANMTSWYLLKPYRSGGIGGEMIRLAAADPQVTVTNFSSSRRAVAAVERAGLSVLDSERVNFRPRATRNPLTTYRDPLALGEAIPKADRRVLDDHKDLNLTTLAVETPDGPCTLALSIKRKHDEYVTQDVFHIGNRAAFSRHVRAIADAILPSQDAVLSVDRRFLPEDTDADEVSRIPVPRFYTPGRMPAEDIDAMYSEIVLLDMKIY